jgi:hypothetical protein
MMAKWWIRAIAAWGEVLSVMGEDAGVAECFLEVKSEHLSDLLRECIESIEQPPAAVVELACEDYVLWM